VTDLRIGEPVVDGKMCGSTVHDNILSYRRKLARDRPRVAP
jgi:hypothetical protein